MNLSETLQQISSDFDLDMQKLHVFAGEDRIGGYHTNPSVRTFNIGAIWGVEGQVLYALAKLHNMTNTLDLGGHTGCSAQHVAAAMKSLDNKGTVTVVDLQVSDVFNRDTSYADGASIEFVHDDAVAYVLQQVENDSVDLIFEDMQHSAEQVQMICEAAPRVLKPGGYLIIHDAMHFLVGEAVRQGIINAGMMPETKLYLSAPSDCGLAIWRKPFPVNLNVPLEAHELEALTDGEDVLIQPNGDSKILEAHIEEIDDIGFAPEPEPEKPKPKRKRARPKKKTPEKV